MAANLRSDGYAVFDALFAPHETASLIDAFVAADLRSGKAGARHLLRLPAVEAFAHDERLLTIARQFVADGARPFRATLFDKSPAANWLVAWHQDTALPLRRRIDDPQWGPWSTKEGVLYARAPAWALAQVIALRVSLDASRASNGPLRVLPDSHRYGVLDDGGMARLACETAAVECVTAAGGVVAMRPLTVHASSKSVSSARRRVLHIEYAASLTLAEGIELAVN